MRIDAGTKGQEAAKDYDVIAEHYNKKLKSCTRQKIKNAKIQSWKEYCNMNPYPWNEVYRLAAGKRKNITQITTLRKPDGSLTADLNETLKYTLEQFAPEDNYNNDSDTHKQATMLSQEPVDTEDDKDFTVGEIRNAVASMGYKKATGEDGITGKIYISALDILPNYITALYNGCLRREFVPKKWKRAKLIPITKTGKENSDDVSKFRPISLLNVGKKVLEKVLINGINYHVVSQDFMNVHQYGFTPQKRHNRRGDRNKGICQGKPSSRGNYSPNKLRRKRCF